MEYNVPEFPKYIGHYKIVRVIGEGSTAVVYLAEPEYEPGKMLAIKWMKADRAGEESINVYFQRLITACTFRDLMHSTDEFQCGP
jgi:serine/threonine protein kinase